MQGDLQHYEVTFALGVGRELRGRGELGAVRGIFVVIERFGAARAANAIHVTPREDGVQPCGEFATAEKIIEQRFALPGDFAQSVQIGVERISELARRRFAGDGAGGAIEFGAILRDEIFPGCGVSFAAGAGQREIGGLQRIEIILDCAWIVGRRGIGEAMRDAAFERGLDAFRSELPFRGRRGFLEQALGHIERHDLFCRAGGRHARLFVDLA